MHELDPLDVFLLSVTILKISYYLVAVINKLMV